MKAPWEFGEAPAPGEPAVENLPTPEGRMLGAQLARLADIEEARLRQEFPRMHPRCDDCAFRAGTRPNGCVETLMDAIKCVIESKPFFCHKGMKDGEPKHLCAGFGMLTNSGGTYSGQSDASCFPTSKEALEACVYDSPEGRVRPGGDLTVRAVSPADEAT